MKKFCLSLLFAICFCGFLPAQSPGTSPMQKDTIQKKTSANKLSNSKFTYKVTDAAEKTFGYDIYNDNKLVIHQPSMPGLPGNKGFETKADAEKVAQLVITKMKKGEMPPTVTTAEMKKLKVIK